MTITLSRGTFAPAIAIHFLVLSPVFAASSTQPATTQATTTASTRPSDEAEVKQLWQDSLNALTEGQNDKALTLLDRLLVIRPDNVDYHLLDARALVLVSKWKEAGVQSKWVLEHAHQNYQKEWATLYRAQSLSKAGDNATARAILKDLSANATSAAVKTTAAQLIDQLEQ